MLIYLTIAMSFLILLIAADIVITLIGFRKSLKDFAEEVAEAKAAAAGAAEKEAARERLIDEGFENIMTYGGGFDLLRKDE